MNTTRSLWRLLAVPALLSLQPGCLVPYCLPAVNVVPPALVNCDGDEVHAFRITVTKKQTDLDRTEQISFSRMTVTRAGQVLPQAALSCAYGYYVLGGAASSPASTSQTVFARLYRPGYQLVELRSWSLPVAVEWKAVSTSAEQERILDELFGFGPPDKPIDLVTKTLRPGSYSKGQNAALRYGVYEYLRLNDQLSRLAVTLQEDSKRLVDKAKALEQRAAE